MSDTGNFGFGRLIPGFDFLQNIAKGATQGMPQMPSLSNWVAPTLNVEELDKRISELKAVQFWLDQNGKALGATIQALEVQKMTLATLRGMNMNMGELAESLKVKTEDAMAGMQKFADAAGGAAAKAAGGAKARRKADDGEAEGAQAEAPRSNGGAAAIDPLQWWGALTQQFQEIAANAMKDVAQKTAESSARSAAGAAPAAAAAKTSARAAKTAPARKKAAASRKARTP